MAAYQDSIWQPSVERSASAQLTAFERWLKERRNLSFDSYENLWQWSIDDQAGFWSAVAEYYQVMFSTGCRTVLASADMPGAQWFVGAELNFVEHLLRHSRRDEPAILFTSETIGNGEISWLDLWRQVGALAQTLSALGVKEGDRVCAILPNTPHAVIAFLATASIGAIWSIASPDMGVNAVIDRFSQIEPQVLIACDGYVYGGKWFHRDGEIAKLREALATSLQAFIHVPLLGSDVPDALKDVDWSAAVTGSGAMTIKQVDFNHPLWILYSSGTTGLPKPIVHGHGGMLLNALVTLDIHMDLEAGDRYFLMSSTGWMVWNMQVMGLLLGATICLFDGSPTGAGEKPDLNHIWDYVAQTAVNVFGSGAAFYALCQKNSIEPNNRHEFPALKTISSTGSPLSPEGYQWIYAHVKTDVWLNCVSGGTDICGAFLTGVPTLPVYLGEMQCRSLGAAVYAFNEHGKSVLGEVGELVCTRPLPSMPLYFWGDKDDARYIESYFDMYTSEDGTSIWRHGDWLKLVPHQSATGGVIYGRSDTTINRHGIRIGSSEIYRAVETLPEIVDSLLVDLEYLGRESYMPLFVQLRPGLGLTDELRARIIDAVRLNVSPRMVPDEIFQLHEVPYTLTGKKVELPIRKLLLGQAEREVINRDVVRNPASLDWFLEFVRIRAQEISQRK